MVEVNKDNGPKSIDAYSKLFPGLEPRSLATIQSLVIQAALPGIVLRAQVDADMQDNLLIQSAGRNDG
jgi:hypothetical protein